MSDTIFLSFMFVPYDQFFLGHIPVLCTAQMNKNSQNPQRSAFNFSKTSLILTASNKMAACLTPGRKETGAEVASFPPFSPLAGQAFLWPITTKIELNVKKILAVNNATYGVAKRKPEKIRLAGNRTLTSAIPVQRSNQLS